MMPTTDAPPLVSSRRRIVGLGLVLLFAVGLRIYFHPRVLGTMEFSVAVPAMGVASGHCASTARLALHQYGVVYPTALSFLIFGENFLGLTAYGLLCSMGSLLVAYAFAARLGGHSAGLGAAFLLAVLPLDIEVAGRAVPDGPQAFFAALALWLFYVAPELRGRWGPAAALGAGLCFGVSYLCKLTTFVLWPVLLVYALLRKEARVPLCYLVAGCGAVLLAETTVNYQLTGDPLARYDSITEKQQEDGSPPRSLVSAQVLPQKFFVMPVKYGLHMYVGVVSIAFLALRSGKKYLFLLLWFLWFVGYVWLGTTNLSPYKFADLYEGHLAIANVPLVALTAVWLGGLSNRWKWSAYLALGLAGVFGANLQLEDSESTRGMEIVARELKARADRYPVYVNIRSYRALAFLLTSDCDREIKSYASTADWKGDTEELASVENAYVAADYRRIRRTLGRRPEQKYPPEVFSPPAHWKEIVVVDNPARESVYVQMRLIRWLAGLPMVPNRISEKVSDLAEETLRGRDVVLYFAQSRAGRREPKKQLNTDRESETRE